MSKLMFQPGLTTPHTPHNEKSPDLCQRLDFVVLVLGPFRSKSAAIAAADVA